jgi:hypothetical protein
MRRWRQLGLLAGTLLGVAVAAELLLRLVAPWLALPSFRPGGYMHSQLHHRYPPNARMHDRFGLERYVVETNEDGLRSGWSRAAFREQAVRIAILGDSFAFGYGLPAEATLAVGLERRLRDQLGREEVGVLNAGIITYSPLLAGALFDDVVRHYAPTATLLMLDISDVADDHMYAGQRAREGRRARDRRFAIEDQAFPDSTLRSLALWNLAGPVQRLVRQWGPPPPPARGRRPARILIDGEEQRDHFFVMRHPLAKTRVFFEEMVGNIDALAAMARAAGSDFALVIGPRHVHWDASESPDNPEAPKYGADATWHAEYIRFFEQVAPHLDYPVVELLPAFRASAKRPLVFDHDPHWNADGHAVVADVLAAFLREMASMSDRASDRMGRSKEDES